METNGSRLIARGSALHDPNALLLNPRRHLGRVLGCLQPDKRAQPEPLQEGEVVPAGEATAVDAGPHVREVQRRCYGARHVRCSRDARASGAK